MDGWHLGCGKRSFESCMAPDAMKLCKRSNGFMEELTNELLMCESPATLLKVPPLILWRCELLSSPICGWVTIGVVDAMKDDRK